MTRKVKRIWRVAVLCTATLLLAGWLLHSGYQRYLRASYPTDYRESVERYAAQYALEPSLLFAVIRTESGFDPQAVSSAGARGLMQLKPSTLEWARMRQSAEPLDADVLFDPDTNICYGAYVLTLLGELFENEDTVLAAYNAGLGNVQKWLADSRYSSDGVTLHTIPYEETRQYVTRVRDAQAVYQELLKN